MPPYGLLLASFGFLLYAACCPAFGLVVEEAVAPGFLALAAPADGLALPR